MITIPMICRTAVNVAPTAPIMRMFAKSALTVLRDIAVALEVRGPATERLYLEAVPGPRVELAIGNLVLSAERMGVKVTPEGRECDTRFTVLLNSKPVQFHVFSDSLSTAGLQLHFINRVRAAMNLPRWHLTELLCRDFSGIRKAA